MSLFLALPEWNSRHQDLSPEAWLNALSDRDARLTFSVHGFRTVLTEWAIPPRALAEHLIYLVTDAACEGFIEGKPVRLQPGELMWLSCGVQHQFWLPRKDQPVTLYHLRFRLGDSRGDLGLKQRYLLRPDVWELRSLMEQLIDELRAALPYRAQRARGLLTAVCAAVLRERRPAARKGMTFNGAQRRILWRYVRDHLADRPASADLARQLRLSTDYFTRMFRRTFGTAPRIWLMQERIRQGADLLRESTLNVSEIADRLGYDELALFSRQFKQVMGDGPLNYRRRSN